MLYSENQINQIVESYLEALYWSQEEQLNTELEALDVITDTSILEFSEDAKEQVRKEVNIFLASCDIDLNQFELSQIGYDLFFTTHGHGVGFWDRHEIYGQEIADKLTTLCDNQRKDFSMYLDGFSLELEG